MNKNCVVIGSGISGITVALIMARHGHRVRLVEKAPRLAPVLRGFSRQGLHLDSGFHYSGGLGKGKVLSVYLDYIGAGRHLTLSPTEVVDSLRMGDSGEQYRIPHGYAAMIEEFAPRFPEDEQGLRDFLEMLRREYEATPFLNLEVEVEPQRRPMRGHTLQSALERYITSPVLRQVLSLPQYFYGVTPPNVRFEDHARFSGSYFGSTRTIQGGGLALTRALETALAENGVQATTGVGAHKIISSPAGDMRGVLLDNGEELPCSLCFITTHPRIALDIAPEKAFRPAYAKRVATMAETASAFIAYGKVAKLPPEIAGGGMHLCPHPECSLDEVPARPVEQRHAFVAVAGHSKNSDANVVGAVVPAAPEEVLPWLGEKGYHHPGRKEGYAEAKEQIISRLESRLLRSMPELAGRWRRVEAATPLTFMRYGNSPTGSLYGVQRSADAGYPIPQTKMPGLYLAGQSVAGPGVLGATVSAFLACSFVVGRQHLLQEVRQCA